MKNSPSHSSFAGIAASLAILGTGCSAVQFKEDVTCEQQADRFGKTLSDLDIMLSAAKAYVEMSADTSSTSAKKALELRPKIKAKYSQMIAQQVEFSQQCPNQYNEQSGIGGLNNVSRFSMLIASVRSRIKNLGDYMNLDSNNDE